MPELVLKLGDSVLQTFVFDKDIMSIGRSRDNDIVVENLSVSRNHGRVRRQGGKYILTDLNSANGTFVNGVRVSKTEIVDNDVITIGKHKLVFVNKAVSEEEVIMDAFGADRTVMVDRISEPIPGVLCVVEGKLKGKQFGLGKDEIQIGKAQSNDIVIADDWFLSKKQTVITHRGIDYYIEDMGGFRKTRLNGTPLSGLTKLKPGDRIDIGNTGFLFQLSGDLAAEEAGRVPQELGLEDSIFSTGISDLQVIEMPSEPGPAAQAAAQAAPVIEVDLVSEPDEVGAEPGDDIFQPADEIEAEMARVAGVPAGEDSETSKKARRREDFVTMHFSGGSKQDVEDVLLGTPALEGEPGEGDYDEEAKTLVANEPFVDISQLRPSTPEPAAESFEAMATLPLESLQEPEEIEKPAEQAQIMEIVPEPVAEVQAEPQVEAAVSEPEPQPAEVPAESEASPEEAAPPYDEKLAREIAMWETGLQNRSVAIRKHAAAQLKRLTGKDYAY